MLKITTTNTAPAEVRLTLEGSLAGPWVAELHGAVSAISSVAPRVSLDLSGVRFVDPQGLALLQQLASQGMLLQELSPFVRELLKARR